MSTLEPSPRLDPDLVGRVREWIDDDPDPVTRRELEALLRANDEPALLDRFAGRLQFGTAGLRGALGGGPNRMNRALVRRAAAGISAWLHTQPALRAKDRGVVIGCDARHGSDAFTTDSARVIAAAGIPVRILPRQRPTPLLAFAVRDLDAAAGIMVTASHNPPADNGYKVYASDGAQIVPPADHEISAAIDAVGRLRDLPLADLDDPRIEQLTDEHATVARYCAGALALLDPASPRQLRVVYTPMHGVGGALAVELFRRAGFDAPVVVAEQFDPDPDFPTVAFPNPEEPGALDLSFDLARSVDADVVLANDPDADRLAVAVPWPEAEGGWRRLTGDEVGLIIAESRLMRSRHLGSARLVVNTIVSSPQLGSIAEHHGVHHETTLTGFKWIVRPALAHPDWSFVLGYEEALGYAVGELVRDKDGLTAALVLAEIAAIERARGRTLRDVLDDVARRHGLSVTAPLTVRLDGPEASANIERLMTTLRSKSAALQSTLGVERSIDLAAGGAGLPPTDGVILFFGQGVRAVIRPSGTEPKLKCYLEQVVPIDRNASRDAIEVNRARAGAALASVGQKLVTYLHTATF